MEILLGMLVAYALGAAMFYIEGKNSGYLKARREWVREQLDILENQSSVFRF